MSAACGRGMVFAAGCVAAAVAAWGASQEMSQPQTFIFRQAGACAIQADVFAPGKSGPYPVLVYIHGGALMYGSRKGIHAEQLQRYLDAGFIVVSIDYRLAPETKLPGIVEDVVAAFRWVREQGPALFGADPARVGVVGHSGGGYLALMAGFRAVPRPKAVVSFYGYGDIVGDWYRLPDPFYCQQPRVAPEESGKDVAGPEISERSFRGTPKDKLYLYYRQTGLWPREVGGHDPAADPAFFVPYCPLRNVTKDYPPTLLLHGGKDTDVPHEQSVLMAAELERQGVAHRFFSYPEAGHGFDGAKDAPEVKQAFDAVVAFLQTNVAGAAGAGK